MTDAPLSPISQAVPATDKSFHDGQEPCMYFRFYAQFLTFPNDVDARAELQTELPGISSREWWKAEPLPIQKPNFLFRVYPQVALFDNYPTQISGLQLYSKRFLALLVDGGVKLEWFPACLVNRTTNTVVSEEYVVVNILERYPAIDPDRSTPTRLIFRETFLQLERQMFRAEENPTRLFVGKRLREVLDREGITGCLYEPVERLTSPVSVINPRRPRRKGALGWRRIFPWLSNYLRHDDHH